MLKSLYNFSLEISNNECVLLYFGYVLGYDDDDAITTTANILDDWNIEKVICFGKVKSLDDVDRNVLTEIQLKDNGFLVTEVLYKNEEMCEEKKCRMLEMNLIARSVGIVTDNSRYESHTKLLTNFEKKYKYSKRKSIHFYNYTDCDTIGCINDWDKTQRYINEGGRIIHTTQMGLLDVELFELGYSVFIHNYKGHTYNVEIGRNGVQKNSNLFEMWKQGVFNY